MTRISSDRTAPASGRRVSLAVAVTVATILGTSGIAQAQSAGDIQDLRDQVRRLQDKIDQLERQQQTQGANQGAGQPGSAGAAVSGSSGSGAGKGPSAPAAGFAAGPLTIIPNGFVELMAIERNRNEVADWASNYNSAIPFPQNDQHNQNEFRLTPRQSRAAVLVQGPPSEHYAAEAYLETDFGAGPRTANSNESFSYSPRMRHFFADYQNKDGDWYLLFGQAWSLVTQYKSALNPRQELIPQTIDGQYVPGFDWLRVPQVRLVKNFSGIGSLGISIEQPQVLVSNNASKGAPAIPVSFNNPGGSGYDPNNNYSQDFAPDVVAKFAFEPGWGHYEVFGFGRWFRDRYTTTPSATVGTVTTPAVIASNTTTAGGGGINAYLPVIPKVLEVQASFLGGKGIGRYGSAQLPDATVNPVSGQLEAMKGWHGLVGAVVHPAPEWTLFAYGGTERLSRTDYTATVGGVTYGYGYGSPLFSNANCDILGSTGGCTANTRSINSGVLGGWWKFYQGTLGNMQLGATYTYVQRLVFSGKGGDPATNIGIGMVSFRYYPFQK